MKKHTTEAKTNKYTEKRRGRVIERDSTRKRNIGSHTRKRKTHAYKTTA